MRNFLFAMTVLVQAVSAPYAFAEDELVPDFAEGPFTAALGSDEGSISLTEYFVVGDMAISDGDIDLGDPKKIAETTITNLNNLAKRIDFKSLGVNQDKARQFIESLRSIEGSSQNSLMPFGYGVARNALWPSGVLPYEIDKSITNSNLKKAINDAINYWNDKKIVNIRPKHPEDKLSFLIRSSKVSDEDKDPDNYFYCASSFGTLGERRMTLTNQCEAGNIIHEFGHALGLHHEHKRPDRGSHVVADMKAISKSYEGQYKISEGYDYFGTEYDLCSIMHYSMYVSARSSSTDKRQRWLQLTNTGRTELKECVTSLPEKCRSSTTENTIGQRCAASATDLTTLRAMYSKP